jgi:hypothetical protein
MPPVDFKSDLHASIRGAFAVACTFALTGGLIIVYREPPATLLQFLLMLLLLAFVLPMFLGVVFVMAAPVMLFAFPLLRITLARAGVLGPISFSISGFIVGTVLYISPIPVWDVTAIGLAMLVGGTAGFAGAITFASSE